MKKYCLLLLVIAFLSSCKGGDKSEMSREDRLKEIKKKETIVRDSYETGVIDSIILLQLVDFLENKYQIEIPLEMLTPENFDTLAGINSTVMKLKKG